ncbi:MAG: DsbA family protein [Aestuariivirga sp.]|uniref:DsbA family protein n=1 Tax=Aestuariivirga sp. TaxID=2650926 RepID=UPI0025C6ACF5|nr:DsbA family protein [Aestuariivirga sp.]MCA3561030.1 DsbA family protein [Aestuariivirga sp.]
MTFRLRFAAAAALLALAPAAFADGNFNDAQKKEIGDIVRQYLLENPEVLLDVSKSLDARQQQQEVQQRGAVLQSSADQIFRSPADYVAGDPEGDVTMVEFFDYNCGWCKKGFSEVMTLLEKDKNLRFVLKEFPIFGGDSDYAAMAAIAAKKQNKYWELHKALFEHEGKVTKEAVDELAAKQGIDVARMKEDMKDPAVAKELADNHALAQALAINGTPAFIVDDKVLPGYVPADGLAELVDQVRKGGGCKLC